MLRFISLIEKMNHSDYEFEAQRSKKKEEERNKKKKKVVEGLGC